MVGNMINNNQPKAGPVTFKCSCFFNAVRVLRPLPCPSDADRAGEFSFGRLELGGPTSSRFSAIVGYFFNRTSYLSSEFELPYERDFVVITQNSPVSTLSSW